MGRTVTFVGPGNKHYPLKLAVSIHDLGGQKVLCASTSASDASNSDGWGPFTPQVMLWEMSPCTESACTRPPGLQPPLGLVKRC